MNEHKDTRGVIFDLDGTLLDTLADLAESVNFVLARRNWETHPVDAYRGFVGDGVDMLVQRALPENQRRGSIIMDCVREVRSEYDKRWARKTRPYPEVDQLLSRLNALGIPLAVLSNKPDDATQAMVGHYFPASPFQVVAGARPDIPKKPDPAMAVEIAKMMKILPEAMLFLGDSNTDMQTAMAAGMLAVGAAWGFRGPDELIASGADHVLKTPLELLQFLEK